MEELFKEISDSRRIRSHGNTTYLKDGRLFANEKILRGYEDFEKIKQMGTTAGNILKGTPDFLYGGIKSIPGGIALAGEETFNTLLPFVNNNVMPWLSENVPGYNSMNDYLNDVLAPEGKAQEMGGLFGKEMGRLVAPGAVYAKGIKALGYGKNFLANVLGYGTAEFAGMKPEEEGLMEMGIQFFTQNDELKKAMLQSLSADEDMPYFLQKLQKAPQRFIEGGILGEGLEQVFKGLGVLYNAVKGSPNLKATLDNIGTDAQARLDANKGSTSLSAMGVAEVETALDTQLAKLAPKTNAEDIMGINVRSDTKNNLSYADLIIDGEKTFETRDTNSLKSYIGKTVSIVKTGEGDAKAIGTVTIGEPIEVNAEQFRKLQDQHLVPKGSKFDIKEGQTKFLYPLSNPKRFDTDLNVADGIVSRRLLQTDTILDDTKTVLDARAKQMELNPADRVQPSGQDPLFDTTPQSYEQTKVEQKEIVLPRNNGEVATLPIRDRARAVLDNTDAIAQEIANSIKPAIGSNVQYFYHTAPLIDKAVELGIPEKLAKKQLFKFAQNYAVTSPRTTTDQNLRNASLVSTKETLGKDVTEIIGSGGEGINEKGYPMMIGEGGIHQKLINDKQAEGLNVNTNPKPVSFAENVSGNLKVVTVDTHAIRAVFHVMNKLNLGSVPLDFIGGKTPKKTKEFQEMYKNDPSSLDVATMIKDTLASQMINGQSMQTEYAVFADIYKKVAELAGVNPAEAQSLTWFSFGDLTGLASEPKTIVELIDDRVDVTSQLTGQSKEEVFKKFMQGGIPLASFGGLNLLDTGAEIGLDDKNMVA